MFDVQLSAGPNPDYPPDSHNGSIRLKPRLVFVESFEQASQVCRRFIEENALGAGNWTGGVIEDDGVQVARVSYNGRVWSIPGGEEITVGEILEIDA